MAKLPLATVLGCPKEQSGHAPPEVYLHHDGRTMGGLSTLYCRFVWRDYCKNHARKMRTFFTRRLEPRSPHGKCAERPS